LNCPSAVYLFKNSKRWDQTKIAHWTSKILPIAKWASIHALHNKLDKIMLKQSKPSISKNLIFLILNILKGLISFDRPCRQWRWLMIGTVFFVSFATNAEPNHFAEPNIRAGVFLNSFPYISRTDAEVGLKYWAEQVGKSQKINVTVSFYDNIKQMRVDFDLGKINFIVAAPMVILRNFDRASLSNGLTLSRHGTSLESLVLVTRQNEGMNEFKNLVGKKIGLISNDDISEAYLDLLSLKNLAQPHQKLFSKVVWVEKKAQLVYDLFFKKVDAIIIFETSYSVVSELNPQIKEQTQVIARIAGLNFGIGLFHKSVPADFREMVITYWLNLGNAAGDQYLLQMFNSDKFERASPEDLRTVEYFLSDYQSLLQHYKKKH
jgi:ABC-type phosphate/phosphonate transport system substrate-binding protein